MPDWSIPLELEPDWPMLLPEFDEPDWPMVLPEVDEPDWPMLLPELDEPVPVWPLDDVWPAEFEDWPLSCANADIEAVSDSANA